MSANFQLNGFPFYRQFDAMDCGPTCLRMIAQHHRKSYSLQYLREKSYLDWEIIFTILPIEIALLPTAVTEETVAYEMTVLLPDTLRTSYQKVIPFRQNMTATVTILTEDKSILERIFENFLDLVKNR